jgi:hypothetical protein
MRGSLAVAAGARPPLRGGARFRGREAATRLPHRVCRGPRVARASGRPDDGRPARKSASAPKNPGGLESWADEPASSEAPREARARWDDAWDDPWPERRSSRASRGSRSDFDLDDNGEPVGRAGTSGYAEWDDDPRGDGDGDGDGDPYAYRDASSSSYGGYAREPRMRSFGESLPSAAGAAVSWLLKAVALVSDATASNLQYLFPRAVPRSTLRALAYGVWALLFFAVFQKLLSTFVLVGGAALLAVAVASGEAGARRGSDAARRNFDTRRGSRPSRGAWGSRGESFDAFTDAVSRRRREAFWRGATARSTRAMREFWNVPGDDARMYEAGDGDIPGDDARGGDAPGTASERAFGGNDDIFEPGDFSLRDRGDASDWSAAATEAAAAAAATAAAAVRAAAEAASVAADQGPGGSARVPKTRSENDPTEEEETFDGAAGAADAGFAFESRASETRSAADAVVDVEAVSFDDWVGRRSETPGRTEETKKESTSFSSDATRENNLVDEDDLVDDERERTSRSRSRFDEFDEFDGFDRFDGRRDASTSVGYDRWASVSRNALDDAARLAAEALGVDGAGFGNREVSGSRSGERKNRWREFLTGRFYGAFQEDVVPVRFAYGDENDETDDESYASETARATAGRTKKRTRETAVPANGRFVNGAWVVSPEGGDDAAPGFGPASSSADGENGDENDVGGSTR